MREWIWEHLCALRHHYRQRRQRQQRQQQLQPQIGGFILLFVGIGLHLLTDIYQDIPQEAYERGGFDNAFAAFSRLFALITAENFQDLFLYVLCAPPTVFLDSIPLRCSLTPTQTPTPAPTLSYIYAREFHVATDSAMESGLFTNPKVTAGQYKTKP